MFDVGLSELMVIAVVALIVIGPERLPRVARTAGHLLGRLQRYVSDVKADINREMQLEELKKLQQQVASQVSDIESGISHEMREVEKSIGRAIEPVATEAVAAPETEPAAVPAVPAAETVAAPAQTGEPTKS